MEAEELRSQLDQMKSALCLASDEDRPAMQHVISQLEDVINSFDSVSTTYTVPYTEPNHGPINQENGSMDEYALFAAEIAALEKDSDSNTTSSSNQQTSDVEITGDSSNQSCDGNGKPHCIKGELEALEGMKCLAPHEEGWGQIGYYPAMISQVVENDMGPEEDNSEESVKSMTAIMVRVVFLQPIVKSQVLCPFFKEDRCRFADHDCRYSHGEIVQLCQLRDYRDPDYSKIIPSARVLAKYHDEMWYKATVTRLTSLGNCEVKFDQDDELAEVGIHETALLSDSECQSSESDDSDPEKSDVDLSNSVASTSILNMVATESLGDWEKYTKGFGSKLMIKMGYVMGSGLGKEAEGRVIPVDAVIVPPGMSLDRWMDLKEKRKNGDCFSVEKRLKKSQKHHAFREKMKEKKQESSVFDFINSKLSLRKNSGAGHKNVSSTNTNINQQSSILLKKEMLTVGESMKKVSKDILKIRQSMKRIEGRDPATLALMKCKLEELENLKSDLSRRENNIVKEQRHRSDKKKLVEF